MLHLKKCIVLPGLCLMLLLSSCPGPKNSLVTCRDGQAYLVLAHFDAADLNLAKVYKFRQDGLFDSLVDSEHVTVYASKADTFVLTSPAGPIQPKFDYRLSLPAISKSYDITNILQTGRIQAMMPHHDPPYTCVNNILSCKVNGIAAFVDSNAYGGMVDSVFILK